MATATAKNNTWKTIDPSSLPAKHKAAYETYKVAYAKASALRKEFETMMNADARLPDGKALIFGYNFGQLGIGIGDKASSTSKKAVSLATYLSTAQVA